MYCERQDSVSLAPGGHIMLLACGVRAVPGRRATRRTSELAPPAVRVRAMLRGWSVAESCAGRRVPASQPVVGRRAHVHDVGASAVKFQRPVELLSRLQDRAGLWNPYFRRRLGTDRDLALL